MEQLLCIKGSQAVQNWLYTPKKILKRFWFYSSSKQHLLLQNEPLFEDLLLTLFVFSSTLVTLDLPVFSTMRIRKTKNHKL